LDLKVLKTAGAWVGLVTTLVVIMMAVAGIITPANAMFYASGVVLGLLFAAYRNRNLQENAEEPQEISGAEEIDSK